MEAEPTTAEPVEETTTTVETTERTEPPAENLIGEAKRKQKAAEKEAEALKDRLDALEDRDRSEVEKAQRRAEKAEKDAAEYESRAKNLERGGWLRSAAQAEGFNDPDDAVAFANLDDVEDQRAAKRVVKDLAASKPHLVKADDPTPPQIGRVLENGQPTTSSAKNSAQEAEVEQAKEFADTLKRLSGDWQ